MVAAAMNRPLQNRVLVLNKSWRAIGIANMERAICLCYSGKARIIDPYQEFSTYTWEDWSQLKPNDDEVVIRTKTKQFRLPEVILLSNYDKIPADRVHFSRRTLYKRDNFQCQYCGIRPGSEELTIDHIIPRSCGGATAWENCVLACVQCNSQKANRCPEDAFRELLPKDMRKDWRGHSPMKLLSVPKKPKFNLFGNDHHVPQSWSNFVSEAYWRTELQNDVHE